MGNILIIVEGEKAEVRLMKHLISLYIDNKANNYEIYSYKANIYQLYEKMFGSNEEEDLDLLQVLKSREIDEEKRKIFDIDYSDILLIFDYDPQDHFYSKEKIIKMKRYFNESTENGKLYINYPMVEAFRHTKCVGKEIDTYKDLIVEKSELTNKTYKQRVSKEALIKDDCLFSKEDCNEVILHNFKKANFILNGDYLSNISANQYLSLDFDKILEKQNELFCDKDMFFVLCTCVFYILDYNYKLVFQS